MTTLLYVEHGDGRIKDGTLKALTAARQIGAPVHALVLGAGSKPAAEAASRLDGVDKVLNAEDAAYDHDLAEPVAALIAAISEPYDTIIASASTTGKNMLPRVAALLDVAQVSDIITVVSPDTFERPIYAGNAIQTVQAGSGKKVVTVRTATFKASGEGGATAPILYVAVGISGAIQHLSGMKDSKVIVAINKDEDAPIFQIADYGLVGDLFQIVPEFKDEIAKAKG